MQLVVDVGKDTESLGPIVGPVYQPRLTDECVLRWYTQRLNPVLPHEKPVTNRPYL
jgi:hypothetical protein